MQASSTVEQPLFQLNDGKKTVSGLIKNIPNFFRKYCGIPSGPEDMPLLHFFNIPDDIVRCDINSIEGHIISNTTIKSWAFTIIRRKHTTKVGPSH